MILLSSWLIFCHAWRLWFMPRSHWAFFASAMYSRWKLMSIVRHREGFTEGPGNLRRTSGPSEASGGIGRRPKNFNACIEIFPDAFPTFCREKVIGESSQKVRRASANKSQMLPRTFAEQLLSPKHPRSIPEGSPKVRRSFGDMSMFGEPSAMFGDASPKVHRIVTKVYAEAFPKFAEGSATVIYWYNIRYIECS